MSSLTPSEKRRQYWQQQITAWQASGQTQLAFCQANDLNYPRFGYWLRKFRQQASPIESDRQAFVPVKAAIPSSAEGLVMRLPNGIELRGVTAEHLPLVEALLVRCP